MRRCLGCGVLVARGSRCARCQPRPFASVVRPSSSDAQGYGEEHRRWRAEVLAREPVCRWPGCSAPATHADHIVPWRHGGARYDVANGQGLCARHHNTKTATEVNARRRRGRR